ncbi:hypothetical protein SOVF_071240 [Spinacia oleracea]|nr:hypothetical protein SOVF_071240 [Spinacia oleracea]
MLNIKHQGISSSDHYISRMLENGEANTPTISSTHLDSYGIPLLM